MTYDPKQLLSKPRSDFKTKARDEIKEIQPKNHQILFILYHKFFIFCK